MVTREKKTAVDRQVLRQEWETLSQAHGIAYAVPTVPPPMLAQSEHEPDDVRAVQREAARDALMGEVMAEAVAHLGERHAVFARADLLRQTLECGVGTVIFDELQTMLTRAEQAGLLIRSGERYTTPEARQREAEILAMEVQGREGMAPIHRADKALLLPRLQGLTVEQQEAVLGMLISRHQVTGIQGRAGVGKTTLLAKATALAKDSGYRVEGLAPSASAARELATTGMQAQTIAAFAARAHKGLSANTLLVLDEAGMASSQQMHMVLRAVAAAGCRLVLVGDTAQLAAVEAGKPFAQLQANGMATALVGQIQRQKNPQLKAAVELAVSGQVALAVELLDKQITQIAAAAERYERMARDYSALSSIERAQTRVIAGTRHARAEINRAIRERLGLVVPNAMHFTLLTRKDLTEAQRRSTLSYQGGDLVQAEVDYPSLGLKRGAFAQVVHQLDHRVMLERQDGVRVAWQPATASRLSVFVPQVLPLAVGERVRVTANDRARGLVNGDTGCIVALDAERGVHLELDGGRQVRLDASGPLQLDYGYCSTVHAAQGQTCERVMIEADAHSLTAGRNTFYVAISRARQTASIYTDDREMLPLAMGREMGKEAALELVADHEGLTL